VTVKKNILTHFLKLIFNNINAFITANDIIPDNEYGFRAGLNTCHQIIHLLYDITNCFNNENLICVDAIFLDKKDTKDAFDFVKLKLILEHFYQIDLRNNALTILESYLFNRKQIVVYINSKSNSEVINSGVPKGGWGSALIHEQLSLRSKSGIVEISLSCI